MTCENCPHRKNRGFKGRIVKKPYCAITDQELPYTHTRIGRTVYAVPTYETPDDCPIKK